MDTLIKWSDFLKSLPGLSYLSYTITIEGKTLFVTLFTLDEPLSYQILDQASPAKLMEIENTLRQYRLI